MDRKILSVEQVNRYINRLFEQDYVLKNVWIKGEVSNCKYHSSGHVYFTVKDDYAAISCVLFKRNRLNIDITLKDGMSIVANGNVSVYEKTGQYQLYVKDVIEDGLGDLYARFEAMKKRLHEKGFFDEANKKPLPYYSERVGIITSDTGAAIRDMVQVAKRRNRNVGLKLYPSLVQGENAKYDLVEGISYFNTHQNVDVIIIGRGGGSIEDLWAFNEEIVARAIYESEIPIISAVGHETDFTISDFVADLRAPTPSAAAELVVRPLSEIEDLLSQYQLRLNQAMTYQQERLRKQVELLKAKLQRYHPENVLMQKAQHINELNNQLQHSINRKLQISRQKVALYDERLRGLSPYERLKGGYAYVSDSEGMPINTVDAVKKDELIHITVLDGKIVSKVVKREPLEKE